ncbi:hypothetical protein J2129_002128 [Methanofollis sp. W23]|uniref:hypothetical protein n=1 Tax=Methanofollis sp. W23 TaxID=2817849 RepID=UPI001AE68D36|nr:hypothetical protein [Methanofollis sp. W23]MBP2146674.1 hypothetical protein [Methanofollis sp. W23]
MAYLVTGTNQEIRAGCPFPIRTLWNGRSDLDNSEITVTIYLGDGPLDPTTGEPALVFSEPFTFGLKEKGARPLSLPGADTLMCGKYLT